MTDTEALEKKFEEVEEHLEAATTALSGYAEAVDISSLEAVTAQVQLLGDQLDMRLRTLPEEAKEVRVSKLDVATLARILNRWAKDLETEVNDITDSCKEAEKEAEKLSKLCKEVEDLNKKIIETLDSEDPNKPELDLGSMLRSVETTNA